MPTDGKSKLTSGQLVGTFEGPGENGQKIEVGGEDGWEGRLGRYLIVQMDHSDKTDKKALHGINLMEVTGFGQTYRTNGEKGANDIKKGIRDACCTVDIYHCHSHATYDAPYEYDAPDMVMMMPQTCPR